MKPASMSNDSSSGKYGVCHTLSVALVLMGLCLLFFTGCELRGKPNPANRPIPSDQVVDFATLYSQNCAGCHGSNGQMGPAPPLNDELFRAMLPEKELEAVLMQGRKNTLMPAFAQENGGTLTATQIEVLVREIKGLDYRVVETTPGDPATATVVAGPGGKSSIWGRPAELPTGVPAYQDVAIKPEDSEASLKRGMAAFARACADCHGDQGHGIKEDHGIANAINDSVFLSLNSNQVLRRIIITGRADLSMPNYAESRPDSPEFKPLTEQEVTDLVALLASWRRATGPIAQPK